MHKDQQVDEDESAESDPEATGVEDRQKQAEVEDPQAADQE